jgi:thioredoxin 1
MIFVSGGKLIHRQVGALPEPVLRDLFEQFVEIASQAETSAN